MTQTRKQKRDAKNARHRSNEIRRAYQCGLPRLFRRSARKRKALLKHKHKRSRPEYVDFRAQYLWEKDLHGFETKTFAELTGR